MGLHQFIFVLILVVICVFILSGTISVLFIITHYYNNRILLNVNSIRIIVVNLQDKTVTLFNKNDMKNVKKMPFENFLSQYSTLDVDRLNKWFEYLLNKREIKGDYLDIEVYINSSRSKINSLLKCIDVNKESKTIFLSSHIFSLIEKNEFYSCTDKNIEEIINSLQLTHLGRGFTFSLKLIYLDSFNAKKKMDRFLLKSIENLICGQFYCNNRYLIEVSDEKLLILDYRSSKKEIQKDFISRILSIIKQFLELNGYKDILKIFVGFISNNHFSKDPIKLANEAMRLSDVALESAIPILDFDDKQENTEIKKIDINEVISCEIDFTYNAIFDVSNNSVLGYFAFFNKNHPNYNKINDYLKYIYKDDDIVTFYRHHFKELVNNFTELDVDKKYSLFINAKTNYFDEIIQTSYKFKLLKDINLVVCIDESEISTVGTNFDIIRNFVLKYKNKNVATALVLKDRGVIFDKKVYELFDCFIVELNIQNKSIISDSSNLDYRVIVEKLLRYNRPIIINKVNGWDEVELLIRSGINYICCSSIVPSGKVLAVPTNRTINRIKKIRR